MKQNDSKTPNNKYNGNPNSQSHQNRNLNGAFPRYNDATAKPRLFPVTEDKAVWATYLNMARQNLCLTLCHICHILGLEYDPDDPSLEENLLNNPAAVLLIKKSAKAEQKQKAMKLFDKHFPFLSPMLEKLIEIKNEEARRAMKEGQGKAKVIKEKTPAMYYEIMETILPLINLLRNKYTHHKLFDPRLDNSGKITDKKMLEKCRLLARLIDYSATGARRIVKERFSVGNVAAQGSKNVPADADAFVLKPEDFNFLEGQIRYFKTSNSNGERIMQERRDFKYRTRHDETGISNMGIFMLICLMLNKKYASEFADKTDFFGTQQSKNPQRLKKEIAIMREIISVYRIRLPKERLESSQDASALGLDMLNELKKCPRELFDTLDAAHQERFRVKAEKDDNEDADAGNNEDADNDKVLMLRSRDRFADFALRYIDRLRLFDDIRFQVRLGYYRYKFYEKEWIDGFRGDADEDDRIRILQKELTGFGRIDEIEPARNERWKDIIRKIDKPRKDSLDTAPYVTDHHASYLFHNNRIGLLWNSAEKQPLQKGIFMPNLDLPEWLTGYPQNADLIRGSDSKVASPVAPCVAPVCWLSIYELPAVIFLSLLTGSGEQAEMLIKNTVDSYHRFFNDLSEGNITPYDPQTEQSFIPKNDKRRIKEDIDFRSSYVIADYGIGFADLPDKVQTYLLSEGLDDNYGGRFTKLAKAKLKTMIDATQDRYEIFLRNRRLFGSKDNKIGKKSHIDIRPGTLARYLAKDIMLFKEVDADNRLKLTGQNFNILQAELALYRLSEAEWRTLLSKAELIDCPRPHPFLKQVLDSHPLTFFDFYQTYLEKKLRYLSKIKDEDLKALHFMHPDRKKWAERDKAFYQELCGRYVSIELPKGLFLPAIVEALKGKCKELPEAQAVPLRNALDNRRKNVAYLIAAYFQALGDGSQDFYGNEFKRYYAYISKLYGLDSQQPDARTGNRRTAVDKRFLSVDELTVWADRAKELEKTYLDNFNREKDRLMAIARNRKRYRDVEQLKKEKEIEVSKLRNLRNEYTQNEKAIRRMKVQDMLLFLMAKNLLTNVMDRNGTSPDLSEYRLKNIGSGTDGKDILSLELPFSIVLQVPAANGSMREITIRQDKLKLKNYGDFFRFIYDTRVRPLLAHARIEDNRLSREDLDAELDKYDQKRIPLFKLVHNLERNIWKQLPAEKRHPADGKVDFKYILRFIDMKEIDKDLLKAIRNAFSHNEYPEHATVEVIFNHSDIPHIAETMVKAFDDETRKIKAKPIK